MFDKNALRELIARAFSEDVGTGDITTLATVPQDARISGRFIAKEAGVLCGIEIVRAVFEYADPEIGLEALLQDGDSFRAGDVIAKVRGRAIPVLTGERLALNFLQRLSGIATRTRAETEKIKGTKARIVDTRKTTPGLRIYEKYAVRVGGGYNHRFNLADGVLIKDNHIRAAGGIAKAVAAARLRAPHTLKIEVETENLAQVAEALEAGADIIMLDNMTTEAMAEAVSLIAGRALVEASGNMDSRDLCEVAATGVDYISMGALTHSVRALDISLQFDENAGDA
ncbi:MAG: carboxylating nicotinate-nucleotide diphosphorylase [Christensenellales bacterium]|jgi:nicotinate-nucleotide pyrophosphorylase (carboxylating)